MDIDQLMKIIGELYVQNHQREQMIIELRSQLSGHGKQLQSLTLDLEANKMVVSAIRDAYPEIAKMLEGGVKIPNKDEESLE